MMDDFEDMLLTLSLIAVPILLIGIVISIIAS
jgi:hypothetical protein